MARTTSPGRTRNRRLVLGIGATLFVAGPAYAQVQPMALGPQYIRLGPAGSSTAMRLAVSYCMDEYLDTPSVHSKLAHVIAGHAEACPDGRTCVSLQRALDRGDIVIRGTGTFGLWFENRATSPTSIHLQDNTVLSDHTVRITAPSRALPTDVYDDDTQLALWDDLDLEPGERRPSLPVWLAPIESHDRRLSIFALRNTTSHEVRARLDSIAAQSPVQRIIVLHGERADAGGLRQLQSDLAPLFDELESLDAAAIVHSDDGRRLVVLQSIAGRSICYVTRDRSAAAAWIDGLPSGTTLVRSGRSPELPLKTPRFTLQRSFSAPLSLSAAIEHVTSARALNPRSVIIGVPKNRRELDAQNLAPTGLEGYRRLADVLDGWAKRLGGNAVSTKQALLKLLQSGGDDLAIVVAHSDGTRIYIGDEVVTLRELGALPSRRMPARRTIILAACKAGAVATKLSELQGFAQLFVDKGFAISVVAPVRTIGREQVEQVIDALGADLQTLLNRLRQVAGGWILLGQHQAPAAERRDAEARSST